MELRKVKIRSNQKYTKKPTEIGIKLKQPLITEASESVQSTI